MLKNTKLEDYISPTSYRSQDISCRISTNGYNSGINFHRNLASKILKEHLSTTKFNRKNIFMR